MFSVCACSFIFIILASNIGMPISGTHTVIGSLLGAGLVSVGLENFNFHELIRILLSWIISPTLTAMISFLLMIFVSFFILNTKRWSFTTRLYFLHILCSFCISLLTVILISLADTSQNNKDIIFKNKINQAILGFTIGWFSCRLLIVFNLFYNQ